MCLDLGELELGVVGVHLSDLLPGRGAENLQRGRSHRRDAAELIPRPPEGSVPLSVPGGAETASSDESDW